MSGRGLRAGLRLMPRPYEFGVMGKPVYNSAESQIGRLRFCCLPWRGQRQKGRSRVGYRSAKNQTS